MLVNNRVASTRPIFTSRPFETLVTKCQKKSGVYTLRVIFYSDTIRLGNEIMREISKAINNFAVLVNKWVEVDDRCATAGKKWPHISILAP